MWGTPPHTQTEAHGVLGMMLNSSSCGEVSVLEAWGMGSTPSLTLLPGPLWPGVVAPVRAPSMG